MSEFHSLLTFSGGHGMPAADTVGDQIVLWAYLNVNVPTVRHPNHGVCQVTWWKVFSDNGEPAFPLMAHDNVLRIRSESGQIIPLDTSVDGWEGVFSGDWSLQFGIVDDLIERMDRERNGDNSLSSAATATNRVLGKLNGAEWAAHCYMYEGETALRDALAEYLKLNAQ